MFNKSPVNIARSKKYGSNFYICHSLKLNRRVSLHSNLEYANFLDVELNPNIVKYLEQPLQVEVKGKDGDSYKTTFDMEVLFKNDTNELWEIKYSSDLNSGSNSSNRSIKQIEYQRKWCLENNITYKVRTENEIFKGPEHLNNMRFMYHCLCRAQSNLIQDNLKRIKNRIQIEKCITVEKLLNDDAVKLSVMPVIVYLFIHGYIVLDIYNQEICYASEVCYAEN
ncbi:TnsA endonuclease N-terminal domain-containing protein [Acetobacterium bakii]|uniref:TnsA endonuclease N-terminal domain-containing protein n=1 Tax=Acetobacterium bakii TaxID=52689 RepID=UPI000680429E|nr:TnsA endonuclease N-terminal domain-containing protein [Acetobacterium bakii]